MLGRLRKDAVVKVGDLVNCQLGSTVKIFMTIMMVLFLLSGCITRITQTELTPVFSGKGTGEITLSVLDHRSIILTGEKEEWFEGIYRSGFGIPYSLKREGEQPFAVYLAKMLQDSFNNSGKTATILPRPKGANVETTVKMLQKSNSLPALIVIMNQSRYHYYEENPDEAEYDYNFELLVVSASGVQLARREFRSFDVGVTTKFRIPMDIYGEVYRKRFESFINDPEINSAIAQSLTS